MTWCLREVRGDSNVIEVSEQAFRRRGLTQVRAALSTVQANYAVTQPSWGRRRQMTSAIKALCRCRDRGRHR